MTQSNQTLIQRDIAHLWHPCTQSKDLETCPPVAVEKAAGSYLHLQDGSKLIDATSSWWCKSLGHGHPRLKAALIKQLDKFEHILLPNTTHDVIVNLSEKLTQLSNGLHKVFYASDGSCAVEIAMKMSLQARMIQGQNARQQFMCLENSYHGETGLAMSVTDASLFSGEFKACLPNNPVITGLPYVQNRHDPLWKDCGLYWARIEPNLNKHKDQLTAVIVEPMLQGAGGMKIYSQDFLNRLSAWCKQNDVHLIADECLTGIGRLGQAFASHFAKPDFICLSKGLTAGFLPMSAVLTHNTIYDLFSDDYSQGKTFMHSHTYSGNALAASVALEALSVMEDEAIYDQALRLEEKLAAGLTEIAEQTGLLENVRYLGALAAADIKVKNASDRAGFEVYQAALQHGALLRPLGNTIYWMPPLNISDDTLLELKEATLKSLNTLNP